MMVRLLVDVIGATVSDATSLIDRRRCIIGIDITGIDATSLMRHQY